MVAHFCAFVLRSIIINFAHFYHSNVTFVTWCSLDLHVVYLIIRIYLLPHDWKLLSVLLSLLTGASPIPTVLTPSEGIDLRFRDVVVVGGPFSWCVHSWTRKCAARCRERLWCASLCGQQPVLNWKLFELVRHRLFRYIPDTSVRIVIINKLASSAERAISWGVTFSVSSCAQL